MIHIKRLIDDDDIDDLLYAVNHSEFRQATIDNKSSPNDRKLVLSYRSTKVSEIDERAFPDISSKLLDMTEMFGISKEKCIPNEMNFLTYEVGDKFKKHKDDNGEYRLLTTVTMLYKSDDLEGGNLEIEGQSLNLDVGQTVGFIPNTLHEVTEVTKGKRIVVVCWICKRI